MTVTIWYRLGGEETWNTLTTVTTDEDSQYSYTWTPATVGTYELKASWPGDANTLPAESSIIIIDVTLLLPPVASFTWSPPEPVVDETVTFDATESYDPDGTIVSYFWDFGDDTTGTGNVTTHAYADDGTYTVTLKVTDNDELSNITTADINVLNRPPVAIFTENATTVLTGEVIHFDASESYDPDGSIVSYFWDFGDNTTEIYMGENLTAIATHTYAEAGNYTVTLTVTDDDGASSSFSATKTVEAPPELPWALFAAVGLGIAALVATAFYLWYRRRKKRASAGPSRPQTKPVVTLYVPSGILAGYEEER